MPALPLTTMTPTTWLLVVLTCSAGLFCAVDAKRDEINTWEDFNHKLPFANPDGGVWKQGFPITFDPNAFGGEKINVFVILWSHNDPGWRVTYSSYFTQSASIITNAVNALTKDPTRYFMWPEVCVLQRWWDQADRRQKDDMRKLVANGQFEIVSGGWVMTDEAAAHYEGMIQQLVEGQDWVNKTFGTLPRTAWSIDPFGHSPTVAQLLSLTGLDGMVINRIHYSIKKWLSERKDVEFTWRQRWEDDNANTDIWTHVLPFFAYDIPHTCGPNPKVCALYDFTMTGRSTLWGDSVSPVTTSNVDSMAKALAEQYRQKAMLFRTNNVLIPVGYDFSYTSMNELESQFSSMQMLFDSINNDPASKLNVRFSNLAQYINAVKTSKLYNEQSWPLVKGDFFTYSDLRQDYWSGYYVSRPFYKRASRSLYSLIRAAETLHSLLSLTISDFEPNQKVVTDARRIMGLFHHHDAITGTSAPAVVRDYGAMLHEQRWNMKDYLASLLYTAVIPGAPSDNRHKLGVDEQKTEFSRPYEKKVITITTKAYTPLVLFNSLPQARTEAITIITDRIALVVDATGTVIPSQSCPRVELYSSLVPKTNEFEVTFIVKIPPLSIITVYVAADERAEPTCTSLDTRSTECLKSDSMELCFNPEGLITSVANKGQKSLPIQEDYLGYSTHKSGPYIFHPEGPASSIVPYSPAFLLRKGPIYSEIITSVGQIVRSAKIYTTSDPVLGSYVDTNMLVAINSKEVVVRYTSSLNYGQTYYTDQNGFSMSQRWNRPDMPISFNFYPITQGLYIEEGATRLSILTGQALGASCTGERTAACEIMLDRFAMSDDGKGLSDPMNDNIPVIASFMIVPEELESAPSSSAMPALTMLSHQIATRLNHPVHLAFGPSDGSLPAMKYKQQFLKEIPEDVSMMEFRTVGKKDYTFLFTRALTVDGPKRECVNHNLLGEGTLTETSLNFISEPRGEEKVASDDPICLKKGDMKAFTWVSDKFRVVSEASAAVPKIRAPLKQPETKPEPKPKPKPQPEPEPKPKPKPQPKPEQQPKVEPKPDIPVVTTLDKMTVTQTAVSPFDNAYMVRLALLLACSLAAMWAFFKRYIGVPVLFISLAAMWSLHFYIYHALYLSSPQSGLDLY